MRRRVDASEPPAELLEFNGIGRGYTRYTDWQDALSDWRAARRKWAAMHGVNEADMPADIGPSPFDFNELIGPVNPATHEVVRRGPDGTPTYIRRKDGSL